MEKKKAIWHFNSLWSLFGNRSVSGNFLRRNFSSKFSTFGFTLVELLIVIALIGILVAGVVTVINPMEQFQKSRDARRKSDLSQIQKALETYYNDIGQYPESSSDWKIKSDTNTALNWGSSGWQYIGTLPKDPSGSLNYVYYSPAGRQSYYLYANLERGVNDPQACNQGAACSSAVTFELGTKCGVPSATCNYGISSPNVSL